MTHKMYITGDMHGSRKRLLDPIYPYNRDLVEGDILFQLGDFGYIFHGSKEESDFLDYLATKKPYTIAFIDGNHENFELLNQYPVESWNGGLVHVIRRDSKGSPKIIHLIRGSVFSVYGKKIFALGGADSENRSALIEGTSWWKEEVPSLEETNIALKNLCDNNYKVDYILTHTIPVESLSKFYPEHSNKTFNAFLEYIREIVSYEHWYIGHMHMDCDTWRNQTLLSFDVIDLCTGEKIS